MVAGVEEIGFGRQLTFVASSVEIPVLSLSATTAVIRAAAS